MAFLFGDGFDSYSALADFQRNWAGLVPAGGYNATAGRNGGGAFNSVTTAGSIAPPLNFFNIASGAQYGGACWIKATAVPSAQLHLFLHYQGSLATYLGGLDVTTTGFLRLVNSSSATLATGPTQLCDGNWHWLEYNQNQANLQFVQCWLDGVVQWGLNVSIGSGVIQSILATTPAQGTWTIDDIFWFDNNAGGPQTANQPFGARQFNTFRPNADFSVQFTPNPGPSNFNMVNEQSSDEGATYVQDATSGQADLYDYDDFAFAPNSILAVQLVSRATNPGGGLAQYKGRCSSTGTVSDGPVVNAPASYQNSRAIYNNDPHTSAAWTGAGFNAAKFGIAVV